MKTVFKICSQDERVAGRESEGGHDGSGEGGGERRPEGVLMREDCPETIPLTSKTWL